MPPKTTSPASRRAQGVYASRVRELGPEHPETVAAQGEWRSERYLAAIDAIVSEAPPLSPEQRARLSAILRPTTILNCENEVSA